MAIGSLSYRVGVKVLLFSAWALVGSFLSLHADQITKKSGDLVIGTITGVSNGQISVDIASSNGQVVHSVVYLSDVKSVQMPAPASVLKLGSASPATLVATLQPLVTQYAGLPADWVLDAMAQLGDAYQAEGQAQKSTALYDQINKLYPGSPYQKEAIAGEAKLDLDSGRIDAALTAVKPLIDDANQTIAPSPAQGQLFGRAYLVYGQALQAQKQNSQALEAYLTVETMFYQSPTLVAQADQLAKKLRADNPGVSVD